MPNYPGNIFLGLPLFSFPPTFPYFFSSRDLFKELKVSLSDASNNFSLWGSLTLHIFITYFNLSMLFLSFFYKPLVNNNRLISNNMFLYNTICVFACRQVNKYATSNADYSRNVNTRVKVDDMRITKHGQKPDQYL